MFTQRMTKIILTRILNQTEPSLPRRNKQEFRGFKKDSMHSSKNHLPLLSRTRHSPIQALGIQALGIPLKPGLRTRCHPIPTRILLPRTSLQCPSVLPQSQLGWTPNKYVLEASRVYYLGRTKMNSPHSAQSGQTGQSPRDSPT